MRMSDGKIIMNKNKHVRPPIPTVTYSKRSSKLYLKSIADKTTVDRNSGNKNEPLKVVMTSSKKRLPPWIKEENSVAAQSTNDRY